MDERDQQARDREAQEEVSNQMTDLELLKEEIFDIITSENSGLSHQARLNEIESLITFVVTR